MHTSLGGAVVNSGGVDLDRQLRPICESRSLRREQAGARTLQPRVPTLSANHSCKPAGVDKKSNNIAGEHLIGYSKVYNCFLVLIV